MHLVERSQLRLARVSTSGMLPIFRFRRHFADLMFKSLPRRTPRQIRTSVSALPFLYRGICISPTADSVQRRSWSQAHGCCLVQSFWPVRFSLAAVLIDSEQV